MQLSIADIHATVDRALAGTGSGPFLVHSDVVGALGLIEKRLSVAAILKRHTDVLEHICGGRPAYFPTFNYDFPKRGHYDVAHDPSQVGRLSEHMRLTEGMWRSAVPVFSVCGRKAAPVFEPRPNVIDEIDPFDTGSIFGHLYRQQGTILFYGAPFSAFTGLHFIERLSGGPVYRYDKTFAGTIRLADGLEAGVRLNYHVRPMGRTVEYDFEKLMPMIISAGCGWKVSMPGVHLFALDFQRTVDLLMDALVSDPFALLTVSNRDYWKAEIDRIGRRVQLADFEEAT